MWDGSLVEAESGAKRKGPTHRARPFFVSQGGPIRKRTGTGKHAHNTD